MAEQLEFSRCRARAGEYVRPMSAATVAAVSERFNWQTMSDAQKQEVLRLCRQRLLRKIRANRPGAEEPQQPSCFKPKITYTQSTFY